MLLSSWRRPASGISGRSLPAFPCRAKVVRVPVSGVLMNEKKKEVVIVGSGRAGLGAARHLSKQGFDVTVIEDSEGYGSSDDVCIQVVDFDNTDATWKKYDASKDPTDA